MLSKEYNRKTFHQQAKDCDIAVVEGVMGLFDGYDALSETGSTAQMAKWLDLPVILIVDAGGMARSAAALVKGFETFDSDLNLAGVIFTKTGSRRHYQYLKDAVEQNCQAECLGFLPRNPDIIMPERHLGLVTAEEFKISDAVLSTLASLVEENIDTDSLMDRINVPEHPLYTNQVKTVQTSGESAVIAVARDKAFCFYYQDNIDLLKQSGARIAEFSPLNDPHLPENIDGIYFGGGYPELFAKELAANKSLLKEIHEKCIQGMPVYGECGGFMFLCRTIHSAFDDACYDMCGCFDLDIKMSKKLRALGYREITLEKDTLIGLKGDRIRGHEFHYSAIEDSAPVLLDETENVYRVSGREGQNILLKGYQKHNTLGSYFHVHFGSSKNCAAQFIQSCRNFRSCPQEKKLKKGFTTGSAAAAAVKAALTALFADAPDKVGIMFLTGEKTVISVEKVTEISDSSSEAVVIKDAGDDPDITHKAEISARVKLSDCSGIKIKINRGHGVGVVTKPGLEIGVGEPAINPGPRKMIHNSVKEVFEKYSITDRRVDITISVKNGDELAKKTLNARLGIMGGISILGTTGIVTPMSHDAYIATIKSSIFVAAAKGLNTLVFSTGRRTERFAQGKFNAMPEESFIQTGDFFKKSLDMVLLKPEIKKVIYAIFFGKAVKMALGHKHTHAARSSLSLERLAQWAEHISGNRALKQKILDSNTARQAFGLIYPEYPEMLKCVGEKIIEHAQKFSDHLLQIRVVIFDFEGRAAYDSDIFFNG